MLREQHSAQAPTPFLYGTFDVPRFYVHDHTTSAFVVIAICRATDSHSVWVIKSYKKGAVSWSF
jgi:hypothetical protein